MPTSKGHSHSGEPRYKDKLRHRRMQASKGHSQTGEPRHKDKSGHEINASQKAVLTNWRAQTQRKVRKLNKHEPTRGTHFLESPDTKISQDSESMPMSEGHSQTGEHRHRDKSGYRKKAS